MAARKAETALHFAGSVHNSPTPAISRGDAHKDEDQSQNSIGCTGGLNENLKKQS